MFWYLYTKKEGKTLNTFILELMYTELKDTLKKQLTWNLHRSHQSLPVSLSFCLLVQQADFTRCIPNLSFILAADTMHTAWELLAIYCTLQFPNQDHADTYTAENLTKLMKGAKQQRWIWRSVPWKPAGIWLCDPEPISRHLPKQQQWDFCLWQSLSVALNCSHCATLAVTAAELGQGVWMLVNETCSPTL